MKALHLYLILLLAGSFWAGCNRLGGKSFDPLVPGYRDDNKQMTILKQPLREISGIDYLAEKKIVAINDESGKIFFLDPGNAEYEEFKFGDKGDYEDVVMAGGNYYVLLSSGNLVKVNATTLKQEGVFKKDFGKGVEFETLYYDKTRNALVLICKECGRGVQQVNAWLFYLPAQQYSNSLFFSIGWDEIREQAKDNSLECKPSAAAIHPVTNKLYIIASVGKVLLQCNTQGKLEKVYGINPDHFQQPEGITFGPGGDMYISNEGIQGKATLLTFRYHAR